MKQACVILLSSLACAVPAQDLLIGHTDPYQTSDVETYIAGDPYYDTVDLEDWRAQTPTAGHLEEYDCVLTWSHSPYQDRTALGDNLADYVDSGGAVVILYDCWGGSTGLGGRIMTDDEYCPMALVWRGGGANGVGLGDYDPGHPILDGVESITGIEFWEYLGVYPGATWLASLDNFYDLAGINADENVVGLNLYPGDGRLWQGDGWILINNAVRYMMDTDTAPPYVDDIYPTDGAGVIPDEVVFHCKDAQSSVDTDTISFTLDYDTLRRGCSVGATALVTPTSPAGVVPGDLDIDDTDPRDVVCTWTPDEPLDYEYYTARVDGSLADVLGNEMGEDFVWVFGEESVKEQSWGAVKAAF